MKGYHIIHIFYNLSPHKQWQTLAVIYYAFCLTPMLQPSGSESITEVTVNTCDNNKQFHHFITVYLKKLL